MPDYHRLSFFSKCSIIRWKIGRRQYLMPFGSPRLLRSHDCSYMKLATEEGKVIRIYLMRVNTESVDDCRMDACQYGIGRWLPNGCVSIRNRSMIDEGIPVLKGQLICFCSLIFNLNQVNISLNEYWRFQCHSAKFAQENSSRLVDRNLATWNSSNVISSDRYVVSDITVVLFDT